MLLLPENVARTTGSRSNVDATKNPRLGLTRSMQSMVGQARTCPSRPMISYRESGRATARDVTSRVVRLGWLPTYPCAVPGQTEVGGGVTKGQSWEIYSFAGRVRGSTGAFLYRRTPYICVLVVRDPASWNCVVCDSCSACNPSLLLTKQRLTRMRTEGLSPRA